MGRLRLTALGRRLLGRGRDGFGFRLNHRQRWTAVEIGHRARGFRRRCRPEFVGDRSGEAFLQSSAPAASATASATSRPPLAVRGLIGVGLAGLLVGFLVVAFAVFGNDAGDRRCFERNAGGLTVFAGRSAFARLAAAAAPPPPPLAPRTAIAGSASLPPSSPPAASSLRPSVSSVSTSDSASMSNGSSSS